MMLQRKHTKGLFDRTGNASDDDEQAAADGGDAGVLYTMPLRAGLRNALCRALSLCHGRTMYAMLQREGDEMGQRPGLFVRCCSHLCGTCARLCRSS